MTLQEFEAWFDGFTEEMTGAPNKKQWERVKRRVKEIDGSVTSYPVFVDCYIPTVPRRYWDWGPYWCGTTGGSLGASGLVSTVGFNGPVAADTVNMDLRDLGPSFNSAQAMLALGKADYQSIME